MSAAYPRSRDEVAVALLTATDARSADEAAVSEGDSWLALMTRAGNHLARAVVARAGSSYGLRVTLVVGKGDNGGDGWAAARRLRDLGARPWVISVAPLDAEVSSAAGEHREHFLTTGGRADVQDALDAALRSTDIAVDCLLGTGATGAPRGDVGEAVSALNRAGGDGVTVVACDLPTGVQADDGRVPGDAVRADLTVTFGARKRGLLLHPGAAHAGDVVVGELGAHWHVPDTTWSALTAAGADPGPLPPDLEKRRRGTVLVVAGSRGMAGAAILVARGALAAGAGLVTVAVPAPVQQTVAGAVPSALTVPLADDDDGAVAPEAVDTVVEQAERADVVAAGPGLTPGRGTREVIDVLRRRDVTLVLDADALNVYRDAPEVLGEHEGHLVLTPHARELARISGGSEDDERAEVAAALAADRRATVVAKGPGTVVAAPDGRVWVNPTGGPQLATGGTGDVLTGMIAATVASTAADVPFAAARACWWHGLAGHLAGARAADRPHSAAVAAEVPAALAASHDLARRHPGWPFELAPEVAGPGGGAAADRVGRERWT